MKYAPLELVTVEFSEAPPPPEVQVRGVFEDAENFVGVIAFRVVDSRGRLRLKVEMPDSDAEDGLVAQLEGWLDRRDPVARLRAI